MIYKIKEYSVFCDTEECGELYNTVECANLKEFTEDIKKYGWKRIKGNKHLCPKCSKKSKK